MNLQQMQYIVEIDRLRSMNKASEKFDMSPSTFSKAVKKLEEELNADIFERRGNNTVPTPFGEKYIAKVKKILKEFKELEEMKEDAPEEITGELKLSLGTSIAPYMLTDIIQHFQTYAPSVQLSIEEFKPEQMLSALKNNKLDIAIDISGLLSTETSPTDVFERNIYRERLMMYGSKKCKCSSGGMKASNVNHKNMLIMPSSYNPDSELKGNKDHEGKQMNYTVNLDNFIRFVDSSEAYTQIPEFYARTLSLEQQARCVCETDENHAPFRDVSIYIHSGYRRDRILNEVINAIKRVVPKENWVMAVYDKGIRI